MHESIHNMLMGIVLQHREGKDSLLESYGSFSQQNRTKYLSKRVIWVTLFKQIFSIFRREGVAGKELKSDRQTSQHTCEEKHKSTHTRKKKVYSISICFRINSHFQHLNKGY